MNTPDPIGFRAGTLGAAVLVLALASAPVQGQPAKQQTAPISSPTPAPPLAEAERKLVEKLEIAEKQLDTDGARVMVASPDGRRRVAATIASQFGVPDKSVTGLRARKLGYGEVATALALSRQLLKRDRTLTQTQAVDRIIALRKSGQAGWGIVARDLGLKLGDAIRDVKKVDEQLVKLDTVRPAERADKLAIVNVPGQPVKRGTPARSQEVHRPPR